MRINNFFKESNKKVNETLETSNTEPNKVLTNITPISPQEQTLETVKASTQSSLSVETVSNNNLIVDNSISGATKSPAMTESKLT